MAYIGQPFTPIAVDSSQLIDGSVIETKIASLAVSVNKLAANAVTSAKIAEGTIITGDMADNAVTTAKIAELAITTARLNDNAVTSAKIADGTIIAGDLSDNAVITAKIAEGAVTEARLASQSVSSSKLFPNILLNGTTTFMGAAIEKANIISTAPLTVSNISLLDGGIHYYTANSVANGAITINIDGCAGLSVGNVASAVVLVTNNATFNAYINAVRIDGIASNTTVWPGIPTSGSANVEVYTFSVIKTAAGQYTTLAQKQNFS